MNEQGAATNRGDIFREPDQADRDRVREALPRIMEVRWPRIRNTQLPAWNGAEPEGEVWEVRLPPSSEHVGAAVAAARTASGLSQAALGVLMRQRGLKWSQATVWSIEKGERNLLWREAVMLREIIGFDTDTTDSATLRDARAYRAIRDIVTTRRADG